MSEDTRPYRSVLYIPGSKQRALEKARSLPVDAIILDLEDAVTPEAKPAARETLATALSEGGYGARVQIVRINGLDTPWWHDDIAALDDCEPDAILLPKVNSPDEIQRLADVLAPSVSIWAMLETPLGVLNAQSIAAHPRTAGFVVGSNDLAKELNCSFRADRLPLIMALQTVLLAARAEGVIAIDGVYNQFKDAAGLQFECEQGRDLGFDGKSLIHPAQIGLANQVFAPSASEISLAQRQIEAFKQASDAGQGVAVVDGTIVENLHVETAQRLLAKAHVIAKQAVAAQAGV
ncbi:CoA ester lyase [Paracoccaceae bacterium]|nr:CoA ester lyase [Paracoccaceae bacterium]